MKKKVKPVSYSSVGVDISQGNSFVENIKKYARKTVNSRVVGGIGLFGGLFDITNLPYEEPILVASTDGVGTKIKVAVAAGMHKGIGIDIVSHCIDDIMVQGAMPLFFLDYIGCGKLSQDVMLQIIDGITQACAQANCVLLGGETAEMPDVYGKGEYDLVGTIIGVVDKKKIIDGRSIREDDILIGIPSSGLHTNGFTLARKIVFEIKKMRVNKEVKALGCTIGEALLKPHTSYYSLLKTLLETSALKGIAHITGGGVIENIPRILPKGCSVKIRKKSLPVPPLFSLLQEWGPVEENEMYRVFNMGIGLVLVVSGSEAEKVLFTSREFFPDSCVIGKVVRGGRKTLLV